MPSQKKDEIAIELLLDGIYKQYGYDFRNYARGTISRRIHQFISNNHLDSIASLIAPVLNDEIFASHLIQRFSITVSELFRDAHIYNSIIKHVLPLLRTYPSFKIWHAGCATGEEVYSLAILLKEAGLLDRATIYATDINNEALNTGKKGIYPLTNLEEVQESYLKAGGKTNFTDYCHSDHSAICISSDLKRHITFANHNLIQDASFGEMHLIMCRNVLIYFNFNLQEKAIGLMSDSLVNGGFLCLGAIEDIEKTHNPKHFRKTCNEAKIFQKITSNNV